MLQVYIDVMEQCHDAPNQEQVGWNSLSVQALQHLPEYAMTLQVLMEKHIAEDRTIIRTKEGIAACTTNCTAGRTAEVVVQDPSICARSVRNVESRMDLRTAYPTGQEYQQKT
jgi:hypothetical protein